MKKLTVALLVALSCFTVLAPSASAAIAAASVFRVSTLGTDTNGGGFVTGASGTDMSLFANKNAAGCTSCQSATVNISTGDGVTAGTTTVTSATGNYSSALIGNLIRISGGTGSVTSNWYQVSSVTNATTIVVDRSTGLTAGTGVSIDIGGKLLSPAIAASAATVSGNYIYVQNDGSGVYSITSASSNVAAGVISLTSGVIMVGYSSTATPTNTDSPPTLQLNVSTATLFTGSGNTWAINFIVDGNSQTASKPSSNGGYWRVLFKNFNTAAGGSSTFVQCSATTNSASIFNGLGMYLEAYANTATPFSNINCFVCVSSANTGVTTDGFSLAAANACMNCVAYGNGRDGFSTSSTNLAALVNVHSESNVRHGYLNINSNAKMMLNASCYGNADCITDTGVTPIEQGTITVTAGTVFTNAASGDFSLNNIANQGALLRAAGYPSSFPRGLTLSYRDVGAAQHQDVPKGVAAP